MQAAPTLTDWRATQMVIILAVTIIAAGFVVGGGRRWLHQEPGSSLVRSWIAVSLVIGLLFFVAASFAIDETTIRNVLIGALAANVGTAVAFYFSTKASEQARQDILNATFGTDTVPDLIGKTEDEARALLGRTSFALERAPDSPPTGTIVSQVPRAGSMARKGTPVVVTLGSGAGQDGSSPAGGGSATG